MLILLCYNTCTSLQVKENILLMKRMGMSPQVMRAVLKYQPMLFTCLIDEGTVQNILSTKVHIYVHTSCSSLLTYLFPFSFPVFLREGGFPHSQIKPK